MFVCLNVDIVMSAITRAKFLNETSKLCLLYSSWLTQSFTVCPTEISHVFEISDGKKVLVCVCFSFSTLIGTWFCVSWQYFLFGVWFVFFLNWYVKLFSLKEFQLSFCTATKSVAVLIQMLFHLSCFHFETLTLIF